MFPDKTRFYNFKILYLTRLNVSKLVERLKIVVFKINCILYTSPTHHPTKHIIDKNINKSKEHVSYRLIPAIKRLTEIVQ